MVVIWCLYGGCVVVIWRLPSGSLAMENGRFIDAFPMKTSIYSGFSMAMLNNQMVHCMRGTMVVNVGEFIVDGGSWCLRMVVDVL